MRYLRVEVIAWAVQIDREEEDGSKTVLLAVRLPLDQQHLLREAVRRVGFLGIAVPEIILLERNRGELRIGAHRPNRDELFDAPLASEFHELSAHDEVVVEELARSLAVRTDAAHDCGEVNHDTGAHVGIHALDGVETPQVVVGARGDEHVIRAEAPQPGDHPGAQESVSAGDDNAMVLPEFGHEQEKMSRNLQRVKVLSDQTARACFRSAGMILGCRVHEPHGPPS